MRRDMFFVVSVFCACTFCMGAVFQYTLILLFHEWDIEPLFGLVFTLNMLVSLPVFGLLTYLRYAIWGNQPLPLTGYFVWTFPIWYAMLNASSVIPAAYAQEINVIISALLAVAVAIVAIQIITRKRKEQTQDAANPAYVRKSEKAEGFFEVVGGTKPNGKPHQIYYTPDPDKAERIAAERRNEGGI